MGPVTRQGGRKHVADAGKGGTPYRGEVPPIRRYAGGFSAPVRRPSELDDYVGKWVGVKNGEVVASADSSSELAELIIGLGDEADGSVIEYVAPPTDTWVVGVG